MAFTLEDILKAGGQAAKDYANAKSGQPVGGGEGEGEDGLASIGKQLGLKGGASTAGSPEASIASTAAAGGAEAALPALAALSDEGAKENIKPSYAVMRNMVSKMRGK